MNIRNGIGIKISWIKSNAGLMYEKLGKSYLQYDDLSVVIGINLTEIEETLSLFEQNRSFIKSNCYKMLNSITCQQISDELSNVTNELVNTMNLIEQNLNRNTLNTVSLVKGVMTRNSYLKFKNFHPNKTRMNLLHYKEIKPPKLAMTISGPMYENYVKTLSFGTNLLKFIKQVEVVVRFPRNVFNVTEFLTPSEYLWHMKNASKNMAINMTFPINLHTDNYDRIIQITDTVVFTKADILYICMENPIIYNNSFNIYTITAMPFKVNDFQAHIEPSLKYLLTNQEKTRSVLLNSLSSCKRSDDNVHICKQKPNTNFEDHCEGRIFKNLPTKSCNWEISKIVKPIWRQINKSNKWIYITSYRTTITIMCDLIKSEFHVTDNIMLTLEENCFVLDSYGEIKYQSGLTDVEVVFPNVSNKQNIESIFNTLIQHNSTDIITHKNAGYPLIILAIVLINIAILAFIQFKRSSKNRPINSAAPIPVSIETAL